MSVLVDTSVWVDFINNHDSPEVLALNAELAARGEVLTCGVVLTEVFQGLREPESVATWEQYFRDLPYLESGGLPTYLAAAELYRSLRRRGITIRSTIDCIIARVAEENGCALLSKDRDLHAIIESGLCHVRAFPLLS